MIGVFDGALVFRVAAVVVVALVGRVGLDEAEQDRVLLDGRLALFLVCMMLRINGQSSGGVSSAVEMLQSL